MSTHEGAPVIGREMAREVQRALRAVLEWWLPSEEWEETGRLLTALDSALRAGDTETVDELTAELETGGRRVIPIGSQDDRIEYDDGKGPVPELMRERVVTLIHSLDGPPASERARPAGRDRGR